MAKAKNLVKQATITHIVHKPLTLISCNGAEGKFETTIQGKTITAYFAVKPDENALKLVKQMLLNSHTSNHANKHRTITANIEK